MDEFSIAPTALEDAVAQLAERQADRTADWLQSVGVPPGPLKVPAAFLLELAAVLQLGEWEQRNVLAHLNIKLPSYREAAAQLASKAARGRAEFNGPNSIPLSTLVTNIWIERFAWEGPALLQADIVFGDCDEEALVDQIADFLWQHHSQLQELSEA